MSTDDEGEDGGGGGGGGAGMAAGGGDEHKPAITSSSSSSVVSVGQGSQYNCSHNNSKSTTIGNTRNSTSVSVHNLDQLQPPMNATYLPFPLTLGVAGARFGPGVENKIASHQNETNCQIEQIHEQLSNAIQTFNAEAVIAYNIVNKNANDEVVALQRQIECVMHKTALQQRDIYEETCRKTADAKESAYKRIHELTNKREMEIQTVVNDVKEDFESISAKESEIKLHSAPARNHFVGSGANTLYNSSSNANSNLDYDYSRNLLISRGMTMYTMTAPPEVEQAHLSSSSYSSQFSTSASNDSYSQCEYEGCEVRPSCNFKGESRGIYCGAHKLHGMINVVYKRCEAGGCTRMPGFNFEGQTERRYCSSHKLDGMVNVAGNTPLNLGQDHSFPSQDETSSSFFGDPVDGQTDSVYSKKRFLTDDFPEELTKKPRRTPKPKGGRCEAEGCKKHPSFNMKGLVGGRFCSAHKMEGMIDVISKRCEECNKQAAFNFEGQTRGRFCSSHKAVGMINVKDKLCEMVGCSKYPTANFEGLSGRRFCTTHKLEGMINFTNKRCEAVGCLKHPKFNFVGKSGRRFCAAHKLEGMVSIS
jgi:hypothetical protein